MFRTLKHDFTKTKLEFLDSGQIIYEFLKHKKLKLKQRKGTWPIT